MTDHGLDHAAAYRGIRERIGDLVTGLDDEVVGSVVPATPEWRITDLIGHLVGVADDSLAGNLAGAGSDAWTAVQVKRRHGRSIAELIEEWSRLGTDDGDYLAGSDGVTPAVCGDRFELFRAMSGRRSTDQITAYDWEGDVAIGHLAFLPPRDTALVE